MTLARCQRIIVDPKSNWSLARTEGLTREEISGTQDMATVQRVLMMPTKELKKDLNHLRELFG